MLLRWYFIVETGPKDISKNEAKSNYTHKIYPMKIAHFVCGQSKRDKER